MRIYLRHADKEYNNGKCTHFKHDPGLTEKGCKDTIKMTCSLYKKFGLPKYIICSPYKRTRQTALFVKLILEKITKTTVKIHCDNNLAEYLGNRYNESLDVTPETSKYNPPHPEKFYQLRQRVKDHADTISTDESVWVISHGIIIRELVKQLYPELNLPRTIPNLAGFYISKDKVEKIGFD